MLSYSLELLLLVPQNVEMRSPLVLDLVQRLEEVTFLVSIASVEDRSHILMC